NAVPRDVARKKMVTPAAIREATSHLRQVCEVSQPRERQVIGADRSSIRYREDFVKAIMPPCGLPRLLRGIAWPARLTFLTLAPSLPFLRLTARCYVMYFR